jgi:phage baseplate assembly protein gpV
MLAKLTLVVMGIGLALAFSTMSFAGAHASSSATTGSMNSMDQGYGAIGHSYKGKVVSYDETGHMIVVNGRQGDKTFDVSNAKISGTVRPDENVTVRYTERDGKMTASTVMVAGSNVSSNEAPSSMSTSEKTAYDGPQFGYGDQDQGKGYDILSQIDMGNQNVGYGTNS